MINLVHSQNPMPEQAPDVRNKNFLEVCTGLYGRTGHQRGYEMPQMP